jgi:hypothetical protein
LPAPKDTWKEADWDGLYNKLGRPETSKDYKFPELDAEIAKSVDISGLEDYRDVFHKAGLTQKQVEALVNDHAKREATLVKQHQQIKEKQNRENLIALQQEWGDHFDANLDTARTGLKKYASPQLIELLNKSGLDSHPELIRLFNKIGASTMETNATGFARNAIDSPGAAKAVLEDRKRDADWNKALYDKNHPRHDAVVKERFELMQKMIPAA